MRKAVAVHRSLVLKSECGTAPVEAGGKRERKKTTPSCLVSFFYLIIYATAFPLRNALNTGVEECGVIFWG